MQLEPGVIGQDAVDHLVEGGDAGDSGPVVGVGWQPAGEILIERLVEEGEVRVAAQDFHEGIAAAAGMGDHHQPRPDAHEPHSL